MGITIDFRNEIRGNACNFRIRLWNGTGIKVKDEIAFVRAQRENSAEQNMKNYQTKTEDPAGLKPLLYIALITINRQAELFIAPCLTYYLSA